MMAQSHCIIINKMRISKLEITQTIFGYSERMVRYSFEQWAPNNVSQLFNF